MLQPRAANENAAPFYQWPAANHLPAWRRSAYQAALHQDRPTYQCAAAIGHGVRLFPLAPIMRRPACARRAASAAKPGLLQGGRHRITPGDAYRREARQPAWAKTADRLQYCKYAARRLGVFRHPQNQCEFGSCTIIARWRCRLINCGFIARPDKLLRQRARPVCRHASNSRPAHARTADFAPARHRKSHLGKKPHQVCRQTGRV